jgi:hypothetical protein
MEREALRMSNNAAPSSIKPNLAETAIGGDNYSHPHSIHLSIAPRSVNHLGIKLIKCLAS